MFLTGDVFDVSPGNGIHRWVLLRECDGGVFVAGDVFVVSPGITETYGRFV